MLRHTLTTVIAAVLAAVVGAQGVKEPTAAQRTELFKKNKDVIEQLVNQTVGSAHTPNEHVKRVKSYYDVLFQFNSEIAKASRDNDAARVEELTRHLETLLDKGLAPTLKRAQAQVAEGTGVDEYREAKERLMAQVDALLGMLKENPTAKASLDETMKRLNEITGPKAK